VASRVGESKDLRIRLVTHFWFPAFDFGNCQQIDLIVEMIYLILGVLIRISPWVRPLSGIEIRRSHAGRSMDKLSLIAVWLPFFGWVSAVVQHQPEGRSPGWQVVGVQSFPDGLGQKVEPRRNKGTLTNGGDVSASPLARIWDDFRRWRTSLKR